jgi:hypothetical protein
MSSFKTQNNDFATHFALEGDEIFHDERSPARSASRQIAEDDVWT